MWVTRTLWSTVQYLPRKNCGYCWAVPKAGPLDACITGVAVRGEESYACRRGKFKLSQFCIRHGPGKSNRVWGDWEKKLIQANRSFKIFFSIIRPLNDSWHLYEYIEGCFVDVVLNIRNFLCSFKNSKNMLFYTRLKTFSLSLKTIFQFLPL